jgi:hypothetical protein
MEDREHCWSNHWSPLAAVCNFATKPAVWWGFLPWCSLPQCFRLSTPCFHPPPLFCTCAGCSALSYAASRFADGQIGHSATHCPHRNFVQPCVCACAGRGAPGSAAARFTDGQKQQAGRSPGHTPFPTKAKVRAATAAATAAAASRAAAAPAGAAAGAAPSGPSHKKEMARAAAHSALKRYSKSVASEAEGPNAATPSPTGGFSVRRGSSSPSPTIPNVSSRLMQPTAASSAKARYSGASEQPDSVMWSPPSGHEAAAAGSSRPRLASKIVVPSPAAPAAGDVSLKALKRSIKSKVAEKAHATLKEGRADTLGVSVPGLFELGGGADNVFGGRNIACCTHSKVPAKTYAALKGGCANMTTTPRGALQSVWGVSSKVEWLRNTVPHSRDVWEALCRTHETCGKHCAALMGRVSRAG